MELAGKLVQKWTLVLDYSDQLGKRWIDSDKTEEKIQVTRVIVGNQYWGKRGLLFISENGKFSVSYGFDLEGIPLWVTSVNQFIR